MLRATHASENHAAPLWRENPYFYVDWTTHGWDTVHTEDGWIGRHVSSVRDSEMYVFYVLYSEVDWHPARPCS
jgi:hypothetical protein